MYFFACYCSIQLLEHNCVTVGPMGSCKYQFGLADP